MTTSRTRIRRRAVYPLQCCKANTRSCRRVAFEPSRRRDSHSTRLARRMPRRSGTLSGLQICTYLLHNTHMHNPTNIILIQFNTIQALIQRHFREASGFGLRVVWLHELLGAFRPKSKKDPTFQNSKLGGLLKTWSLRFCRRGSQTPKLSKWAL